MSTLKKYDIDISSVQSKLASLQSQIEALSKKKATFSVNTAPLDAARTKLTELSKTPIVNSENIKTAEDVLKQLSSTIESTAAATKALAEVFKAELTPSIEDTTVQVQALDGALQFISTGVDVFSSVQKGMADIGKENPNLQNAMQKLINIQNVLNGVQELNTQLVEDSKTAHINLRREQQSFINIQRDSTDNTGEQTDAFGDLQTTTTLAANAITIFGKNIWKYLINPTGAAVGILGLLGYGIYKSRKEEEELIEKSSGLTDLKKKWDELKYSTLEASDQLAEYVRLQTSYTQAEDKTKWMEEHTTALDNLGQANRTVNGLEDFFIKNTDAVVKAFQSRALAAAAQEQMREAANNLLNYRIQLEDITAQIAKLEEQKKQKPNMVTVKDPPKEKKTVGFHPNEFRGYTPQIKEVSIDDQIAGLKKKQTPLQEAITESEAALGNLAQLSVNLASKSYTASQAVGLIPGGITPRTTHRTKTTVTNTPTNVTESSTTSTDEATQARDELIRKTIESIDWDEELKPQPLVIPEPDTDAFIKGMEEMYMNANISGDAFLNNTTAKVKLTAAEFLKLHEDEVKATEAVVGVTGDAMDAVAGLMKEGSKEAKAFTIASMVVDTIQASFAAYKAMVGVPIVGPALAPVAAGVAAAAGAASIAKLGGSAPSQAKAPAATAPKATTPTMKDQLTGDQYRSSINGDLRVVVLASDIEQTLGDRRVMTTT